MRPTRVKRAQERRGNKENKIKTEKEGSDKVDRKGGRGRREAHHNDCSSPISLNLRQTRATLVSSRSRRNEKM